MHGLLSRIWRAEIPPRADFIGRNAMDPPTEEEIREWTASRKQALTDDDEQEDRPEQ